MQQSERRSYSQGSSNEVALKPAKAEGESHLGAIGGRSTLCVLENIPECGGIDRAVDVGWVTKTLRGALVH